MTRQNIDLCFPDATPSQQTDIIKQSITHTTLSFLELAGIWFKPIDFVLSKIKVDNLPDNFFDTDKPKIVIAPHFGSWELLNLWLASKDDVYSLYKPAKSVATNNFVLNGRTRTGAHLIPTSTSGLRSLLQALKRDKTVMILPDQRPHRKSAQLNTTFFGHTAPTTTLIYKLTSKINCSVFMAAAIRTKSLKHYKIVIKELDSNQLRSKKENSVTYLNAEIEKFISCQLEQYQWSYRRFTDTTYGKK